MGKYVKEDLQKLTFKVNRKAFTSKEILETEREAIFSKCWLYIGHESELPNKGDFHRRKVGGRNLMFTRSQDGVIRAFYNSCPHRGALVTREAKGNSKVFRCFYHAWSFNNKGELVGMPDKEGFPNDHNCDGSKNLAVVKRVENYRGFIFVNYDDDAISLEDYLGNAKEYLDIVADQSEAGMEVLTDPQEYSVRANWKLLGENSVDLYHAVPTHKTFFDIVATRGGIAEVGDFLGEGRDLGNGHAVMEYRSAWGRPIGKWIEGYGEEGKKEIDKINARLVEKFGEERAERISKNNRNIWIFPNLVINDIMAVTVRTFYPIEPGYLEVTGYHLAPQLESEAFRAIRNDSFLEFLGPGGFSTPDDNEALELCQEGFLNNKEVEWNDISKGMNRENPQANDEVQMRAFWREWNRRIVGKETEKEASANNKEVTV
jgi:p-cumate 2,3-dioxygenase alpha subunit